MEQMKKWACLLLILLLLFAGRGEDSPAHTTAVPTTTFPVQTDAPLPTEREPATTAPETIPQPSDEDFVLVTDYIPGIVIDLKYATTENFTGQVIYESDEAYLRYGTVKKLMQVQEKLNAMGLSLKLWDGYRPPGAQFKLWDIYPDGNYVSDPNKGFSSHSRGNTVDVTLVDSGGRELPMPTGFDDFTKKADRDYSDCSDEERQNALLLEDIMIQCGFKPYSKEWWHYSDTDQYEVAHDMN